MPPTLPKENDLHKSTTLLSINKSAAGGKTNRTNLIIRQPSRKTFGYVKCTNCKKPANLKRVTKDVPENGKHFYACTNCDFFEWADETELPTESTGSHNLFYNFISGIYLFNCHCSFGSQ